MYKCLSVPHTSYLRLSLALCEGLWARTLMTVRCLPPVDVRGAPHPAAASFGACGPRQVARSVWVGRGTRGGATWLPLKLHTQTDRRGREA